MTTVMVVWIFMLIVVSCKNGEAVPQTGAPHLSEIVTPVDPDLAQTVGFFMEYWNTKSFEIPPFEQGIVPASASHEIAVDAAKVLAKIPPAVYAHNANIWMHRMVDAPAFMSHIATLKPQVIRWPAGSGSDAYFWNAQPGQLPADVPAKLLDKEGIEKEPGYETGNPKVSWRGSLENYYQVLSHSQSKGLITVNYGYARYGTSANPVAAAAHLAAEWVRYDKGRTPYWEVGNENFGDWEWGYRIDVSKNKDGQPEFINGKLYAEHFKVFADSMHKAAAEIGASIKVGAVLFDAPALEPWQTPTVKTWNTSVLSNIADAADYYVVHNYFTPYKQNSKANEIIKAAEQVPGEMMSYLKSTFKATGAKLKPISMSEWNMWAEGAKQQVSNVSGLFAVMVVVEAIKSGYGLAARWDLFNSWANGDDHGLFSDGREPGVAIWTPRPSFHYMYFLQKCMGDRMVSAESPVPQLKTYASTFTSGETGVVVINESAGAKAIQIKLNNKRYGKRYYWYQLEGGDDNGEFSRKVLVNGQGPSQVAGGPQAYTSLKARSASIEGGIKVTIPPLGAVMLVVDKP